MPMHGPGARKQAIPFGPSSPSAGWSGCWRVNMLDAYLDSYSG